MPKLNVQQNNQNVIQAFKNALAIGRLKGIIASDGADNFSSAGSNRNLLDNPFFQVNQRSFTTSTGNTYTVDRWIKSGNAAVTLSNGVIVFDASSATSSYNFFSQRLAQDLTGRTVTLSLMTDDGTIYSKSGVIPARTSSAQTAISLAISTGVFLEFTVSASSAAYTASIDVVLRNGHGPLNIKAVKLELGSVSTLANDAPPDYWSEWAICRRYFKRYKANSGVLAAIGVAQSTTVAVFVLGDEPMAKLTVTATYSGNITVQSGDGTNHAVTAISATTLNGGGIVLNVTTSGLTQGDVLRLRINDANAYIDLSADL